MRQKKTREQRITSTLNGIAIVLGILDLILAIIIIISPMRNDNDYMLMAYDEESPEIISTTGATQTTETAITKTSSIENITTMKVPVVTIPVETEPVIATVETTVPTETQPEPTVPETTESKVETTEATEPEQENSDATSSTETNNGNDLIIPESFAEELAGIEPVIRDFRATAYCPCAKCCGVETGITASGAHATPWCTVAAGRSYPFGTVMYIPYFADMPNGGWFIVQDRGGAISDDRIDVYFATHQEALNFGVMNFEVYVFYLND